MIVKQMEMVKERNPKKKNKPKKNKPKKKHPYPYWLHGPKAKKNKSKSKPKKNHAKSLRALAKGKSKGKPIPMIGLIA